jgi:hypothetical protein
VRGSTLVASQVPLDRWHYLIGDPTLADAILDRIVYSAYRIQLRGVSFRRKEISTKPTSGATPADFVGMRRQPATRAKKSSAKTSLARDRCSIRADGRRGGNSCATPHPSVHLSVEPV